MEFDISRCYSAINADELHEGDKVIVADDLSTLKEKVKKGENIETIREIYPEDCQERFDVEIRYTLAYLVERKKNCTNCGCAYCNYKERHGIDEQRLHACLRRIEPKTEQKAEKHYRPFKDTDELIKVFCEKTPKIYDKDDEKLFMPYIWVREKGCEKSAGLITCYGSKGITVRGKGMYFDTLFTMFEFLDGTPCGVEE